jgi:hypothetical protein
MKDSKLIRKIALLDANQLTKLQLYVASPYFNMQEGVIKLCEIICKAAPDFSEKKLSEQRIFNRIFPKKEFNAGALAMLKTKLLRLLENFLLQEGFQESITTDPKEVKSVSILVSTRLDLIDFYRKNKNMLYWGLELERLRKDMAQVVLKDETYFSHLYKVELAYSSYQNTVTDNGIGDVNFQKSIDRIDIHYLIIKLKMMALAINHQRFRQIEYEHHLSVELMKQTALVAKLPFIGKVWYTAFLLLTETENKATYYHQLRNLIEGEEAISLSDLGDIFIILENTCVDIFKGAAHYKELFYLYKHEHERGLLIIDNVIDSWRLKNVMVVCMAIGEIQWAKAFLSECNADTSSSLFEAMILFEEGHYEEVLSHLQSVELSDIYDKLLQKRLYLKVWFMLRQEESLLNHINAFRKFLTDYKSKIQPPHIEGYRNFIQYSLLLFKATAMKERRIMAKKIQETILLADRKWLTEQAEAKILNEPIGKINKREDFLRSS